METIQKLTVNEKVFFTLEPFDHLDGKEEIYGIILFCKGNLGVTVHPNTYRTFDAEGNVLQTVEVRNNQYFMEYKSDVLRTEITPQWQECYFEAFVKKNSARLEFSVCFCGEGEVEIGEVQWIKGGCPERTHVKGVPYMDLIENMTYREEYEKTVPQVRVPVHELSDQTKEYLQVDLQELLDMIPERKDLLQEPYRKYTWSPLHPEMLTEKATGKMVRGDEIYPISGYEDVVCPSGKVLKYAYYNRPRKQTIEEFYLNNSNVPDPDPEVIAQFYDPEYERVYLDNAMVTTRVAGFFAAAQELAGYYFATKDPQAGLTAACILAKLAHYQLDWPIYGRPDWNYNVCGFFPADFYEGWYAFMGSGWWSIPCIHGNIQRYVIAYELMKEMGRTEEIDALVGLDARTALRDVVFAIIKHTLKCDAYFRCDLWKFFHNTFGGQMKGYLMAGLSMGCPEIIHYAVEKVDSACNYLFMSDGFFPESVSYLGDMLGILRALRLVQGYSDPKGYTFGKENVRYDDFDIYTQIPGAKKSVDLYRRMKYPDGTELTIHDTWSSTQREFDIAPTLFSDRTDIPAYAKEKVEPYLLSNFGHGVLADGTGSHSIETHLHYSCKFNHAHEDMLNLALWAYGDELLSDVGYSHMGGYNISTPCHNTVVVDKSTQVATIGDPAGNLLDWYVGGRDVQFIRAAADRQVYPQTERYRRSAILLPLADHYCVVDLFEVTGGSVQDYMLAGVADYSQTCETTLQPVEYRESMADDGKRYVCDEDISHHLPYDDPGCLSNFYGMFYDAQIADMEKPFTVTLRPKYPDGEDFPGAGWRAPQAGKTACLKIHVPAASMPKGQAILCKTPRYRYYNEVKCEAEAMQNLFTNEMHKLILRSEGEHLSNTFVTVLEPFETQSVITSVVCEQNSDEGVVLRITTSEEEIVVLFRKNEGDVCLVSGEISSDARLAVVRKESVTAFGGGTVRCGADTYTCAAPHPLEVLSATEDTLRVRGELQEYAGEGYCAVVQSGQNRRYLKVKEVRQAEAGILEICVDNGVGFDYNFENEFLRETAFPHYTLYGKAMLEFPKSVSFSKK